MYGVTLYDVGCHRHSSFRMQGVTLPDVVCYTLHSVTAATLFFGHQGALSCLRHFVKHLWCYRKYVGKNWHLYVYFISCWQKLYYSRQTHNKMANRLWTAPLAHYCTNSILYIRILSSACNMLICWAYANKYLFMVITTKNVLQNYRRDPANKVKTLALENINQKESMTFTFWSIIVIYFKAII